jgi:hypothetical protein
MRACTRHEHCGAVAQGNRAISPDGRGQRKRKRGRVRGSKGRAQHEQAGHPRGCSVRRRRMGVATGAGGGAMQTMAASRYMDSGRGGCSWRRGGAPGCGASPASPRRAYARSGWWHDAPLSYSWSTSTHRLEGSAAAEERRQDNLIKIAFSGLIPTLQSLLLSHKYRTVTLRILYYYF